MINILQANTVNLIEPSTAETGAIHLGSWEVLKDIPYLTNNKITFILSAIPSHLANFKHLKELNITQKIINSKDEGNFNMLSQLDEASEFIKKAISEGNLLIHCAAGISRSTTCLVAYYIRYLGLSMEEGIKRVKKKREIVCPNVGFMKQLRMYEDEIYERKQKGS